MNKFYSQYGQDRWLHENIFPDKRDGVFVEIGADDGIHNSNTLFFEKIGWTGVCIEPSYNRFEHLKQNRACICENVAIDSKEGVVEFMDISGYGKGLSGIVDKYSEAHKNRIDNEIKHKNNKGHQVIQVKTQRLDVILRGNGITRVDFCSIDTEGCEYDIISSLDFDSINIDIFLIENNYNEDGVSNFLSNVGYKKIAKINIDDVYQRF